MDEWHDETFDLERALVQVEDPEPGERIAAVRALIKNAPETALVVLDRLVLSDPDRSIRLLATAELARLRSELASTRSAAGTPGEMEGGGGAGDEPFAMRRGPPPGVPRELRWVVRLDWVFAVCFGIYALLHVLVPLIGGPGAYFRGSIVRFATDSTLYHVVGAVLCYAAAKDFGTQGLPGSVIQFMAALMILPSFPAGPVVGAYMLYKVFRPVPREKR